MFGTYKVTEAPVIIKHLVGGQDLRVQGMNGAIGRDMNKDGKSDRTTTRSAWGAGQKLGKE